MTFRVSPCTYQILEVKCLCYLLLTHIGITEVKSVCLSAFLDLLQKKKKL
jgi:hypothetical protein